MKLEEMTVLTIAEHDELERLRQKAVQEKLDRIDYWLHCHKAEGLASVVYDGNAIIESISRGLGGEFSITLRPVHNQNIGAGIGCALTIKF